MALAPVRDTIPTALTEQLTHNQRVVAEIARIINAATSESDVQGLVDDGQYLGLLTKTANYTLTPADNGKVIMVDTSGGAVTITLPLNADISSGWNIVIKDKGSATTNNVTIARNSNTIDGAASNITLSTNYHYRRLVFIGSSAFLVIGSS
jgi:hypothetical protein